MDSSPPEIMIEEATPRPGVHSKRRKANERAKTTSPPSSPVAPTRHYSPKQQHISSPAITIEEAERSLKELIDDFERGKLQAFGSPRVVERMQEIRAMQENLTRRHFELDRNRVNRRNASLSSKKLEPYSEMAELTQELEHLTKAIQNLHTETQHSAPSSRGRSPVPDLHITVTSTPYEGKHSPREAFLTPSGLPDTHWSDKHDSLSSLNNSRDEGDFDYPVQESQINKDRKYSHTSSSSSLKQETVV